MTEPCVRTGRGLLRASLAGAMSAVLVIGALWCCAEALATSGTPTSATPAAPGTPSKADASVSASSAPPQRSPAPLAAAPVARPGEAGDAMVWLGLTSWDATAGAILRTGESRTPRGAAHRFDPGALQMVRTLPNPLTAMAASRSGVFLVLEDRTSRGKVFPAAPRSPTRVLRMHGGTDGLLSLSPERDLPAYRPVLGAAAHEQSLCVVLGPDPAKPAMSSELWVLASGTWWVLPAPGMLDDTTIVFGTPAGVALVARESRASAARALWLGALALAEHPHPPTTRRVTPLAGRTLTPTITWAQMALPAERGEGSLAASRSRHGIIAGASVGDRVVLALADDGGVALRTAPITPAGDGNAASWRELARVDGATSEASVAPVGDEGLVLYWRDAPAAPAASMGQASGETTQRRLREGEIDSELRFAHVSASGRVLAQGTSGLAGPASPADLRLIALILSAVVAMIALLLIRPPRDSELDRLPEGVSLAPPWRRFWASLADASAAFMGACAILGVPPMEALTMGVGELFTTGSGQALLLTFLGLGAAAGAIMEASLGWTPGKLLTGCRVVAARSGIDGDSPGMPRRPSLGQAVARNLVKWLLPPAGLGAIMVEGARHRGELYARTFVVVDDVAEEE